MSITITVKVLRLHYLAIDLFAQLTISAARMRLCVVLPELWMFWYSAVNMAFSTIPRKMTPPIQNWSRRISRQCMEQATSQHSPRST